MAKNISLMGADYPQVPAVQLPQTGGGTATFYDIKVIDNLNSDSETDALSAKQGKVLDGKVSEASNKVYDFVNSGKTTITITTEGTLEAKSLFMVLHRNSENGVSIVSGNGVITNLTPNAALTAAVSGNSITLTGNNLYYARVTVMSSVPFTVS